jgi:hypothetical protein
MTLVSILAVFGNIAALLPAFLCGATFLYIFFSIRFLHTGVVKGLPMPKSLYDLIRVNGLVALFLGVSFIIQGIALRGNADLEQQLQVQMDAISKQMADQKISDYDPMKLINAVLDFMLVIGILLFTHIMLGFVQLKKFFNLFSK